MTKQPKILITGASGFIGGFLVEEALRRGYDTWAGVRASSSRAHLQDPRIHFIDLDYADEAALTAQLANFAQQEGPWDFVIHNAGLTKTTDKRNFFKVNAENTRRFAEALTAADCRPKKFLLMSSLSSYGMGDETHFSPIRLDDQQRPNTAYGQSKLQAEQYIRQQNHFPYVILRPTGVYGPGERDYFLQIQSVARGIDCAVGSEPQRITFIYVKDLAQAAFLTLEKEEIRNRHYFVADGDVYTDEQFSLLIQELLGKKHVVHARIPLPLVHLACRCCETVGRWMHKSVTLNSDKYIILKQRNWICDVEPLKRDTGFEPAYDLRRGLEESIAWYRAKRWLS